MGVILLPLFLQVLLVVVVLVAVVQQPQRRRRQVAVLTEQQAGVQVQAARLGARRQRAGSKC
jgi:beta-lactam-binding protein with PASTA domain